MSAWDSSRILTDAGGGSDLKALPDLGVEMELDDSNLPVDLRQQDNASSSPDEEFLETLIVPREQLIGEDSEASTSPLNPIEVNPIDIAIIHYHKQTLLANADSIASPSLSRRMESGRSLQLTQDTIALS